MLVSQKWDGVGGGGAGKAAGGGVWGRGGRRRAGTGGWHRVALAAMSVALVHRLCFTPLITLLCVCYCAVVLTVLFVALLSLCLLLRVCFAMPSCTSSSPSSLSVPPLESFAFASFFLHSSSSLVASSCVHDDYPSPSPPPSASLPSLLPSLSLPPSSPLASPSCFTAFSVALSPVGEGGRFRSMARCADCAQHHPNPRHEARYQDHSGCSLAPHLCAGLCAEPLRPQPNQSSGSSTVPPPNRPANRLAARA